MQPCDAIYGDLLEAHNSAIYAKKHKLKVNSTTEGAAGYKDKFKKMVS